MPHYQLTVFTPQRTSCITVCHAHPTADIMVTQGVRTIVAVDVSAENNNDLSNYGDHISGWYLMVKKFFPFGSKVRVSTIVVITLFWWPLLFGLLFGVISEFAFFIKVPDMSEVQSRLAYTTSTSLLSAIKSNGMCEYVRPPIDQ